MSYKTQCHKRSRKHWTMESRRSCNSSDCNQKTLKLVFTTFGMRNIGFSIDNGRSWGVSYWEEHMLRTEPAQTRMPMTMLQCLVSYILLKSLLQLNNIRALLEQTDGKVLIWPGIECWYDPFPLKKKARCLWVLVGFFRCEGSIWWKQLLLVQISEHCPIVQHCPCHTVSC